MNIIETIYANEYEKDSPVVHLTEKDAINNASEGAKQIPIECIDPRGTVKVYFETEGYAELVAIFDSSETYNACVPALEKLAKKNGFTKVTESLGC
jgi:hypothetical protein